MSIAVNTQRSHRTSRARDVDQVERRPEGGAKATKAERAEAAERRSASADEVQGSRRRAAGAEQGLKQRLHADFDEPAQHHRKGHDATRLQAPGLEIQYRGLIKTHHRPDHHGTTITPGDRPQRPDRPDRPQRPDRPDRPRPGRTPTPSPTTRPA